MHTRILYLFTRTPLHVGAGSSVGAIDQPVIRERHTGFPVIPASSLKGSFVDQWPLTLKNEKGERVRLTTRNGSGRKVVDQVDPSGAAWLFGSDDAGAAAAGALLFSEARLLAFPIRSAKGSYAWITSPLLLRRAARDGVLSRSEVPSFPTDRDGDEKALFLKSGPLSLGEKIVLEEYTFSHNGGDDGTLRQLGAALACLIEKDPVWAEVASRLVVLSDGQMSYFATTACEVAQHVRIDDETGTADSGGLFNQENVPSDTLLYSVLRADKSRLKADGYTEKSATDALDAFAKKLAETPVFQFGADASTGLGYCTVCLREPAPANQATAGQAA
jgi:CRISPR-associated protein Cmr4